MKIVAYAPRWIPTCFGLRDRANALILIHEYYNVLGLECKNPWCLVFEQDKYYLVEVLVIPLQAIFGFRLCKRCRKRSEGLLNGR